MHHDYRGSSYDLMIPGFRVAGAPRDAPWRSLHSATAELGSMRVTALRVGSAVSAQVAVEGSFIHVIFADSDDEVLANGQLMGEEEMLLLSPPGETVVVTSGPATFFGAAFSREDLVGCARELDLLEDLLPRIDTHVLAVCPSSAVARFRQTVLTLCSAVESGGIPPEMVSAGRASVLEQVVAMLAWSHAHASGSAVADPERQVSLRLIREFIEASGRRPVTVAELSRATFTSERALRALFIETYCMRPKRYLKSRDVARLHEALLGASPEETSASRAAELLGLTLTGRLAAEYRLQYGESPSKTLQGPGESPDG
jgi:AraC family ethanolamine operon transcriptional activator